MPGPRWLAGPAAPLLLLLVSSCSSPPPVSVQLSASATLTDQGESVRLTAATANDSSRGVFWTLTGPGSLRSQSAFSATYVAPTTGSSVQSATITATSVADRTKAASVSIAVNPLPLITTESLANALAGSAYSQNVKATGGTPPFTWSVAYGALPTGLAIDSASGAISGTPTAGGTWYFWVRLTDAVGAKNLQSFLSIEVLPNTAAGNPVPFLNQPLVPGAVAPGGPPFTLTLNGTGFLPASTVDFNGSPLATTFVSAARLTALVPSADIAAAGAASITVVNPSPGGGISNAVLLPVSSPETAVSLSPAAGSPLPVNLANYVVTGDFRGRNRSDIAIAQNGNGVYLYLANGDGTFTLAPNSPIDIPSAPWDTLPNPILAFLAAGDFNHSGHLGLAVANQTQENVPILTGNGDGTFTLPSSFVFSGGSYTNALAVGDFLGNGNLDLAVTNFPAGLPLDIVLGCGNGAFNQAPASTNGSLVSAAIPVVGDFNGDGKLDLAVTGGNDQLSPVNAVTILTGNGDGTFHLAPNSSFATGANPQALVAADFNGDGKLDLAIANWQDASLTILIGNGDGTFTPAPGSPVRVGNAPWAIAAGDLNSDGKLDLVVANQLDSTLTLLLGNGDGTFTPAAGSPIVLPAPPNSIALGDFNSSGRLGVAVATGSNVQVLVQQP